MESADTLSWIGRGVPRAGRKPSRRDEAWKGCRLSAGSWFRLVTASGSSGGGGSWRGRRGSRRWIVVSAGHVHSRSKSLVGGGLLKVDVTSRRSEGGLDATRSLGGLGIQGAFVGHSLKSQMEGRKKTMRGREEEVWGDVSIVGGRKMKRRGRGGRAINIESQNPPGS